ncbi:protein-export membrane protein SecF [Candidatus Woesebacteria bacterium RIFOXYB1_FULL_38_16]|uniref:Protein-export membrane protein SecF n=1 Tax=Candidatus Woesebacteria bacterium RIFOXYB1_FULL_38_16 TaxID=1802538 RepID=A0A1F8CRU5_9BACT|nr:MAG: protein-export membrane protein SecF [Candidatus Woesebacteria bacterium RIFOXYA1_FULL_38_9]OGM79024.1 MAG: protein-export membrane protein SecF [Candidatus Woesebacteria bacterium RIFOXYB1_FULL_38_16]
MRNFNWLKYKMIYFVISGSLIVMGIFSLYKWGISLGVDFVGGSLIEYDLKTSISSDVLKETVEKEGIDIVSVQNIGKENYLFKFSEITNEQREKISVSLSQLTGETVNEARFEKVGPSLGAELIRKTIYALIVSASAILLWVAISFKSFKFGVSAILAMFHDSFILIGSFSLFGHFFSADVDFLFITALLTTLSFSVHDTIVVFDRIREINRKHGGEFSEVCNRALSETMKRSINNSITIILMLSSLIVLGGSSIFWFAIALLVGTVLGTYSSPFVAVPLLVAWNNLRKK